MGASNRFNIHGHCDDWQEVIDLLRDATPRAHLRVRFDGSGAYLYVNVNRTSIAQVRKALEPWPELTVTRGYDHQLSMRDSKTLLPTPRQ